MSRQAIEGYRISAGSMQKEHNFSYICLGFVSNRGLLRASLPLSEHRFAILGDEIVSPPRRTRVGRVGK